MYYIADDKIMCTTNGDDDDVVAIIENMGRAKVLIVRLNALDAVERVFDHLFANEARLDTRTYNVSMSDNESED